MQSSLCEAFKFRFVKNSHQVFDLTPTISKAMRLQFVEAFVNRRLHIAWPLVLEPISPYLRKNNLLCHLSLNHQFLD